MNPIAQIDDENNYYPHLPVKFDYGLNIIGSIPHPVIGVASGVAEIIIYGYLMSQNTQHLNLLEHVKSSIKKNNSNLLEGIFKSVKGESPQAKQTNEEITLHRSTTTEEIDHYLETTPDIWGDTISSSQLTAIDNVYQKQMSEIQFLEIKKEKLNCKVDKQVLWSDYLLERLIMAYIRVILSPVRLNFVPGILIVARHYHHWRNQSNL